MKETVSGVRFEGKWEDVVNRGEDVTRALEETAEDDVSEWDEWRPKEEERLAHDVREKTVEKAQVDQNPVEKAGKGAIDEAEDAVKDAGKAVAEAAQGDVDSASEDGQRAVAELVLTIDTAARKALRRFESFVYRHIMARTNPHYFDSELVSASIDEKSRLKNRTVDPEDKEYVMSVNINDDDVFEKFRDRMKEREDE